MDDTFLQDEEPAFQRATLEINSGNDEFSKSQGIKFRSVHFFISVLFEFNIDIDYSVIN